MNVTRTSMLSGKTVTLNLPVTQKQLDQYAEGQTLLQDCFPQCSPALREFIKTGITPSEWDETFG